MKVTVIRKRRVLKRWVKNTLWTLLGSLIGIIFYSLVTEVSTYTNSEGTYSCRGSIIKVCTGSQDVYNYEK